MNMGTRVDQGTILGAGSFLMLFEIAFCFSAHELLGFPSLSLAIAQEE